MHIFEPGKSKTFPNITKVELLLGGIPQVMFPDGTLQFADQDQRPVVIYSPRLLEPELEEFCRQNIKIYEQHYQDHKEAIDNFETQPIVPFW